MTVVAELLLVLGAALAVVAGIGAVRFSTAYARIHAAGVASPIAFLVAALGGMLELGVVGAGYILIAAVAMLVTLPVGAHLLFRAVHRTTDGAHLRNDDLATAERRTSSGDPD